MKDRPRAVFFVIMLGEINYNSQSPVYITSRELEPEGASFAKRTFNAVCCVMTLEDTLYYRKSESRADHCSAVNTVDFVISVPDIGQGFGGNSLSSVADRNSNLPVTDSLLDLYLLYISGIIQRVIDKIIDDL